VRSGSGFLDSLRYDLRVVFVQVRLPGLDLVARIAPGVIPDYKFVRGATAPFDPHSAILHPGTAIEAKAGIVDTRFQKSRKFAGIVLEAP